MFESSISRYHISRVKNVWKENLIMIELNQVYRCDRCGNIVEVVHASGGTLSCCEQAMTLVTENILERSNNFLDFCFHLFYT